MRGGGRRPSVIASQASIRARDKRKAARNAPVVLVSLDAAYGIIDRECEKQNRRWFGVKDADGNQVALLLANEMSEKADSRKEARQMLLAVIDKFPVRT